MRTCTKCKKTLPITDFWNHKGCPEDREVQCKYCMREHIKKRRKENKNVTTKTIRKNSQRVSSKSV